MTQQSKQGSAHRATRVAPFHRKKLSALLLVAGLASAGLANAGAVITFGSTSLGVNDTGELNFTGIGPGGLDVYGVYRAGVGDAISPGCLCEGWGVAVTTQDGFTAAGFANQAAGSGGLTGGTFGATSTTATSQVGLSEVPVSVRHAYGPSLAADVFQAQVTITNNSANTLKNVTYRRAMDWDVPPTVFNEYVTHAGVQANLLANGGNVKFASNNGFASSDPRVYAGEIGGGGGGGEGYGGEFFIGDEIMAAAVAPATTINVDFTDAGPNDHGSVFDFDFGDLAPGASRIFNIFYGSANSEAGALAALAQLAPNVYSLGQNSGPGGETDGTPATFIFAFGGVGGVEPGSDPDHPILPFVPAPGVFEFDAPQPRRWFDPPMADGFLVELFGDAEFTEVGLAPGFMDLILTLADGTVLDDDLDAGEIYHFGPGVSVFKIVGIDPDVDAGDPSAFPLYLDWTGTAARMRWTAIEAEEPTDVPEPGILALLGIGLVGMARRRFAR